MSNLKKLEMLKAKVDEAVSKRDKLQGRYDADMDKLKAMGYETLEEADAYVERSQEELDRKQELFNTDLKKFEEKYADYL